MLGISIEGLVASPICGEKIVFTVPVQVAAGNTIPVADSGLKVKRLGNILRRFIVDLVDCDFPSVRCNNEFLSRLAIQVGKNQIVNRFIPGQFVCDAWLGPPLGQAQLQNQ